MVEEAAYKYSRTWGKDNPYAEPSLITLEYAFLAGAEWQTKQSPWISVEERLPGVGDIVLTKGTYGFLICHLSPFGEWKTESHVNKNKLGITHFMYIPLL